MKQKTIFLESESPTLRRKFITICSRIIPSFPKVLSGQIWKLIFKTQIISKSVKMNFKNLYVELETTFLVFTIYKLIVYWKKVFWSQPPPYYNFEYWFLMEMFYMGKIMVAFFECCFVKVKDKLTPQILISLIP